MGRPGFEFYRQLRTIAFQEIKELKELKRRWSYFIRKVYKTDPLVCPTCSGEMHIITFIDQRAVTK